MYSNGAAFIEEEASMTVRETQLSDAIAGNQMEWTCVSADQPGQ